MALFKLRRCTTIFTMRFSPPLLPPPSPPSSHGLYAGLEMVVANDGMLLLVMCLMIEVTLFKRVRLTRNTRPGVSSHSKPDREHPTPRRWRRLRLPSSEGVGGGRASQSFSSPWVIVCTW